MQRLEPLVTGQIYHVFNKTIDKKRIFEYEQFCQFFAEISKYYRSTKSIISHSFLHSLDSEKVAAIMKNIEVKKYFRVSILSYCLMPTHFHFLLKQKQDDGIARFISNIANSFTHYYNLCHERKGPLFLPTFKAVRVRGAAQLIHTSRYIHLNPCTSEIVTISNLLSYKWSSYRAFITGESDYLVDIHDAFKLFNNNNLNYKEFVESNAEYQKVLKKIKKKK
ncbi:hypothetical protein A3D80_00345 [Candidatus Roizmanbacteria bacterium RIFCSPHIGHO2_02_FULL_40_13b]|uniref:Transposase IS200-like domain-containing protein n=1 Tax=Candidatus Roizmanbacteria bacterium RIFCSPHIGHO2_01_FULL_39_24 TaxID=1802032 RepID=A0A1F7GHN6_9BACT|nr:MAG: hypothetical protein A2799_03930 [Candidatus Roizmanbacteria bacterium RIFCSPHIGHO2_01_FULL_39_24]OGK26541.1 MAG: hypothetical protein A3D80_00345 [Candidatus Roizmanbacteria bacterium RIFCSPHIGHO2_02_FULL_40_13b]OGK49391.1 MAG: hypothetical protein A3A56_01840 [Candidatus Roizmanbacteria bacterium RIFCSPLOWO2_01_FULL_40_32]OGK56585.1 MAG: hypothetical protein A3H83_03375 [Candidatus Roizmanbacteria bacterium RIFCSPLOWO2_02_FULL_39_8]